MNLTRTHYRYAALAALLAYGDMAQAADNLHFYGNLLIRQLVSRPH